MFPSYGQQGSYIPGQQGSYVPGQPFDWRSYATRDFSNYTIQNYGVTPQMINTHAAQLFNKYDFNHSGSLSLAELVPLLNEFMMANNLRPLFLDDALALMNRFDIDRSGTISYQELEMMLASLGGHHFSPSMIQQYYALPNRTTTSWRTYFTY